MKWYATHRTIEQGEETGMKQSYSLARTLAGLAAAFMLLLAPCLHAQQPPKSQPAQQPQSGSTPAQGANAPSDANQFPEDTNAVPVIGKGVAASVPPSSDDNAGIALPTYDSDPARSPDDTGAATEGNSGGFSSNAQGAEPVIPERAADKKKRSRHDEDEVPVQAAGPKDDENVGSYYLDRKNWKAALSRFTSAMVLDPENPDVYWGMAEAQRNMGQFAAARSNYQKVVDYDPDSKHGKEAKRLLKTPEIQNAKADAATVTPTLP